MSKKKPKMTPIPCKSCIVLARCRSNSIVYCRVLWKHYKQYDYWQLPDTNRKMLQSYAEYLNKNKWSLVGMHDTIALYHSQILGRQIYDDITGNKS